MDPAAKKTKTLVLVATILGSTVVFLDGSVVNLALPKIAHGLHTGFAAQQWIADGYLLTLSAFILLGGSLGDIFGRKKIYLGGLVGFGLMSLACAVAPSAAWLTAARVVQGCFGALVVPGALSIINTNFPREERGAAIGSWTAWTSAAFVIGPLVGGLILDLASWRWIFLINLPLIAACLVPALPAISESKYPGHRHIDVYGAGLAALALAGITYGLIGGPAHHWSTAYVASLIVGLLLSAGFVMLESAQRDPMVSLSLFKSRNFSGSNLMTFAMYGALGGFTFALAIYLQTRLGYSSLAAGFSLLPVSIVMFLFAKLTGKLSAVYGPRLFMTAGPLLAAVGMALLYFMRPGMTYAAGVLPGVLIFSLGLVLTVSPLTTTVMTSVDDQDSGIASGINNAVSRAAGLIVVALLGLAGADHFYRFSMALCAALAFIAGLISFAMIENPRPAMKTGAHQASRGSMLK